MENITLGSCASIFTNIIAVVDTSCYTCVTCVTQNCFDIVFWNYLLQYAQHVIATCG